MVYLTVFQVMFFSQKHVANLPEMSRTVGFLHTRMNSETPSPIAILYKKQFLKLTQYIWNKQHFVHITAVNSKNSDKQTNPYISTNYIISNFIRKPKHTLSTFDP
jgi:hypothetical protein